MRAILEEPVMSGESDKPRADPNTTIQLAAIEGLDGIELNESGSVSGARGGVRLTPPPLPREAIAPSASPSTAGAKGVGKTVAYTVMLIAVVGLATAAGLSVGSRARAKWGLAAAPSIAPSPTASTIVAPGSASARVLTLPPIEIKGP
jgi:hypothetical protein